jgi:hypothetical protein
VLCCDWNNDRQRGIGWILLNSRVFIKEKKDKKQTAARFKVSNTILGLSLRESLG